LIPSLHTFVLEELQSTKTEVHTGLSYNIGLLVTVLLEPLQS